MRTRARNPFSTITTAGLLLPVDLLVRIAEGDSDLKGLDPKKDYHLRSERLNEATAKAWNECQAAWKSFRRKFQSLPASDSGTTITRDEWLLPLFEELDYGRLQTKAKITIGDKEYPVSHGWESHVPIHLISARYALDRRTAGAAGAATRSPYSMMQELLNRSAQHRWGFVSNGLKLFLLCDNLSLARAANVEFDLEAMMEGEVYADFQLLFLLSHQSRVELLEVERKSSATDKKTAKAKSKKQAKLVEDQDADCEESLEGESDTADAAPAKDCWLDRWSKQAEQTGVQAREKLRYGVENAIKALGTGFLESRGNTALRERLRSGTLSKEDYYRQLLRLVYRLIMTLVAEEKRADDGVNLLHPPGTSSAVRGRYARFYSVGRLRVLSQSRRGTTHPDLYESLKVLFEKLRRGYPSLGIPALGSFLFSPTATPDLDGSRLDNEALLDCIRALCITRDETGRGGGFDRAVDFGNLGAEELGSVYESLLELHPLIDSDAGPFTLSTAAGNERKTTGSYYTPTSLINCLLDSALDPVVYQAIDKADPTQAEKALLDLKICDPACGSGHFLIAAAERMAKHLARLRTGDDEPSTLAIQHAKRDIIGRCIYGVDLNPMAVELCKVSLWMEALEPGKPLSFLDHHIQCGNSLLGATPALLIQGIPDDAFTAMEGDDKKVVQSLKKDNKQERKDYQKGYRDFHVPFMLGNLPAEFAVLTSSADGTPEDIAAKERRYSDLVGGMTYLNACFLADAWCAAFVWKKDDTELGRQCPTEREFRRIEATPHSATTHVRAEVQRLRAQYQFFHWHLSFPDVFRLPSKEEVPDRKETGWSGGFDVLLGNPPWERVKLQEKEWFAERVPNVATARNAADRKRRIAVVKENDPILYQRFLDDCRLAEAASAFARRSGVFPLCGVGDVNTFAIFAEQALSLRSKQGRIGIILPQGIITDDTTKAFFQHVVHCHLLRSALCFVNERMIFPAVLHNFRFSLVTLGRQLCDSDSTPVFAFNCLNVDDAKSDSRAFSFSSDQIRLLNPLTQTCPTFARRENAEIMLAIYRRLPIIGEQGIPSGWDVNFGSMLHMGAASEDFRTVVEPGLLPVYESKMIQQFNHRYASYAGLADGERAHMLPESKAADLSNPFFNVEPCYFIPEAEVHERLAGKSNLGWLVVSRRISNPALARTCIAAIIPLCGTSDSITLLETNRIDASKACVWIANMNSFIQDFCLKQKQGGVNVSLYIQRQLPIVPFSQLSLPCPWDTTVSLEQWIRPRALELTFTAWDLESFARDCGYAGPPFCWNDDRRHMLRSELDAAFFHIYFAANTRGEWCPYAGETTEQLTRLKSIFSNPREAVDYVMETFAIVKRKDIAKYGDYRTKLKILEIYDRMQKAIAAGEPYQTLLDPPPADPRVAHPPREAAAPTPQQVQSGRVSAYIQLLLHQWGKPVERAVVELGLLLMLNDDLRTAVAGKSSLPKGSPTTVRRLNEFLGSMNASDLIDVGDTGQRQLLRLGTNAVPQDAFRADDRKRATETVAAVESYGAIQLQDAFNLVDEHVELDLVS